MFFITNSDYVMFSVVALIVVALIGYLVYLKKI